MLTPFTLIGVVLLIAALIYAAVTHKIPGSTTSAEQRTKKTAKKTRTNKSTTPFLDQYTIDFTAEARDGSIDPVIGREEEVLRLAQVLSRRNKNNALLIGEPGVGKTAIAEALAQRIVSENVPTVLKHKRVLSLDVATLLSGTKYRGEFEERAKHIVTEIEQSGRSIILFIDEVHAVIQSQGTEGAVNFADILKPALARGDLQMIGATTLNEYEQYIKTDLSLERRFQPIIVDEPSREETLAILQGVKEKYADYHKVEFTDAALEAAVDLSTRYVKDRKLPDKAIDAMDEAAAMVRVSHVHDHIPALLYAAAVEAHPDIADVWKRIQSLDAKLIKSSGAEKQALANKRETLEDELNQIGLKTVDSSDVEAVVRNS